jgi:hypothetical protein
LKILLRGLDSYVGKVPRQRTLSTIQAVTIDKGAERKQNEVSRWKASTKNRKSTIQAQQAEQAFVARGKTDCNYAFQVLKEKLTIATLLVLPDFEKPFTVVVDASDVAVGGVLLQDNKHANA